MFIAMTGAKNFVAGKNELSFKIGRNSKGISHIRIIIDEGLDLYNMEFLQVRVDTGCQIKEKIEGVYGDQLQAIFTNHTGLYTSC